MQTAVLRLPKHSLFQMQFGKGFKMFLAAVAGDAGYS
jgi:hypothetical protein